MKKSKKLIVGAIIIVFIITLCLIIYTWQSIKNKSKKDLKVNELIDSIPDFSSLPDTVFPSAMVLEFDIHLYDTITSGELNSLEDLYKDLPGIFTFRGGSKRNHPNKGHITGSPSCVETEWAFQTEFDTTMTKFGQWGGGTGWTGQPLLIKWPDSLKNHYSKNQDTLIYGFSDEEIIFTSLCGDIFFLNPETGKPTRKSISIGNILKGTPSIDPSMNGLLYVGHGVPRSNAFGISVINLFTHKIIQFFNGLDSFAWKRWGAFDSSPIVVGQFLFWPGENGLVYKFFRTPDGLIPHSVLRYSLRGQVAPGIESSIAVFKNYGYFGDNHGNIICFNLNNLKPVWRYNNLDDTDATIVIEEEKGIPYIYTGSEMDKQHYNGFAQIAKINGLNGNVIWQQKIKCRNLIRNEKKYDGGMFSTPLLGDGNCSDLIFCTVSLPDSSLKADLIAFSKNDGTIKWKLRLDSWSWPSPVPFYNEQDSLFIFTGDVNGNIYLIEGSMGKVLFKKQLGQTFESSPLVIGNSAIFGSRGRNVYKFSIK